MLATYKKTGKMMVQILFDSVCNCLGAPPHHPGKPEARTWPEDGSETSPEAHASPDMQRRTPNVRLELRSDEWGVLQDKKGVSSRTQPPHSKKHTSSRRNSSKRSPSSRTPPPRTSGEELHENAKAVADAKRRAKDGGTSRRRRSKSRGKSPDTIFRKRPAMHDKKRNAQVPSSSFSKFLTNQQSLATALCFATPIRDDEEDENSVISATDDDASSAANTLNTAGEDDTIMFEVKYGTHNKKKRRPPMMLFPQFQVKDEKDELRRIVASESHKSFSQE